MTWMPPSTLYAGGRLATHHHIPFRRARKRPSAFMALVSPAVISNQWQLASSCWAFWRGDTEGPMELRIRLLVII